MNHNIIVERGNNGQVNYNSYQNNGETAQNQVPNYNNYAQNVNDAGTPKKKSKAPIIIVVVLIVVLLLGCIVLGVGIVGYNVIKNVENVVNTTKTSNFINTNEVKNKANEIINNTTNTNTNSNTNTNANTNSDVNTNTNTSTTGNTTVTDVKTSTRENPLTKGTWGIASKYSTETSENEDIYVRVTNIVRGDEAKKAVQDYVNSSSFYKYEDPKEGLEWVVVDYDIDFADYTKPSIGANARVDVSLKGSGTRTSVVYNGMTYILTSTYIGSSDYVKTQTAKGKVAFQMPIGCKDYVMQFGASNGTNAYFKGE